jgi:hypothetical protein
MIIIPDQKYNPNFVETVTSETKLAPGVSLSKFLGAKGNATSLETSNVTDKKQLLCNHLDFVRNTIFSFTTICNSF